MAPMEKPDPRYEEYGCGTCNMTLVTDVDNRLHSRVEAAVYAHRQHLIATDE